MVEGSLRRAAPEPVKRLARRLRSGRTDRSAGSGALQPAYDYMADHGIQRGVNNALMVQRALDRGVDVQAGHDDRVQMSFDGSSAWFNASNSSLNRSLARRVAGNKSVTTALLRAEGVRAPESCVFRGEELPRAWAWAEPILPVVVTPSIGQEGRLVHVNVTSGAAFERAFAAVAAEGLPVLVEQFVSGVDHRVTVIDRHVVAATRRIPAHVVGDGSATVEELIAAKNTERRARHNLVHKQLSLGTAETRYLTGQELTSTSVPAQGRTVWLRGTANFSTGGDAIDATEDLTQTEIEYIEGAARAFPGMRFCGVDVLLDREGEGDPWILEVNSRPSVSPHHFPWEGTPRDAMTAVLEAMFPALPPQSSHSSQSSGAA